MKQGTDSGLADVLNRELGCMTLDEERLRTVLDTALDNDGSTQGLLDTHPTLLASSPVFLSGGDVEQMREIVRAVDAVVQNEAYRAQALAGLPDTARVDRGGLGAFLGFDFHLSTAGPQLIEINTNAGGALLSIYLTHAQRPCCKSIRDLVGSVDASELKGVLFEMLHNEWRLERGNEELRSIAIVDEDPREQFLYPELLLFQRLFERRGLRSRVADPGELTLREGGLWLDGSRVDLIYNRLTDFYLESPRNRVLRKALFEGSVVLTPCPRAHALYANKRNLTFLSDTEFLHRWNVKPAHIDTLRVGVPRTVLVTKGNTDELWSQRRKLFFKPLAGYGSRGAYRGAKLTRRVWQSIVESEYVAQQLVPPSERCVPVNGELQRLKLDVRCYVYDGEIQLLGARIYQGQTTNLRSEGGGLASVFTAG